MSYKKALEEVLVNLRCIDITENDQVESYVDDSIRIIKKVLELTDHKDCGFEPSISKKEYEMRLLEEACTPVANYLKKNQDPHCAVIITDSQIRLVRDEIGIPVRTAQEVPVQEQPEELIWNNLQNHKFESSDNFLKIILDNAVRNNGLNLISEQLGISIQEVKNLRKGGSTNINTDKLFKFINGYIVNPKIMIKD